MQNENKRSPRLLPSSAQSLQGKENDRVAECHPAASEAAHCLSQPPPGELRVLIPNSQDALLGSTEAPAGF